MPSFNEITFYNLAQNLLNMGRGGCQVVSVLAFYSEDPSSNPAEVYSYFL